MYKIYINEKPILLLSKEEGQNFDRSDLKNLYNDYTNPRFLMTYIDNFEKGNSPYDSILVVAEDLKQLRSDFFNLFQLEEAAGGLVKNDDGEYLAIFRRGYWDLPKGKLDSGESFEQAALREVEEETGVRALELGGFLQSTYHSFRKKSGKRILKHTKWYAMEAPNQGLSPQTEEDIEQADWLSPADFKSKRPIYANILDVLQQV